MTPVRRFPASWVSLLSGPEPGSLALGQGFEFCSWNRLLKAVCHKPCCNLACHDDQNMLGIMHVTGASVTISITVTIMFILITAITIIILLMAVAVLLRLVLPEAPGYRRRSESGSRSRSRSRSRGKGARKRKANSAAGQSPNLFNFEGVPGVSSVQRYDEVQGPYRAR